MAGILEDMGFQWSEDPNDADLILYNTCTIRDNAEQKVYSWVDKRSERTANLTLVGRWLRRSAGRRSCSAGARTGFSNGTARQPPPGFARTGI